MPLNLVFLRAQNGSRVKPYYTKALLLISVKGGFRRSLKIGQKVGLEVGF